MIKITKNEFEDVRKMHLFVDFDYTDMCWNSRSLRWHNIGVAIDYADKWTY